VRPASRYLQQLRFGGDVESDEVRLEAGEVEGVAEAGEEVGEGGGRREGLVWGI
jgi:hypothetical protein